MRMLECPSTRALPTWQVYMDFLKYICPSAPIRQKDAYRKACLGLGVRMLAEVNTLRMLRRARLPFGVHGPFRTDQEHSLAADPHRMLVLAWPHEALPTAEGCRLLAAPQNAEA